MSLHTGTQAGGKEKTSSQLKLGCFIISMAPRNILCGKQTTLARTWSNFKTCSQNMLRDGL